MKFSVQTFRVLVLSLSILQAAPACATTPQSYTIAIANLGPHPSLLATIKGFKAELATQGFDQKNTRYIELDVGFNRNMIPSMLAKLSMDNPDLVLTITTSVSQAAKSYFKKKHRPLVYTVVTDPVKAGLIPDKKTPGQLTSGSSDQQDVGGVIGFIQTIVPSVKSIGVPYSPGEANDIALIEQFKTAAKNHHLRVVPISVDDVSEFPLILQAYRDKIDVLYVGSGNMIQPALPTVAAVANKYHIPLFSLESSSVKSNMALGSYSISYENVGASAGKIAAKVLRGIPINTISPIFPLPSDHRKVVNKKIAARLKIDLSNLDSDTALVGG